MAEVTIGGTPLLKMLMHAAKRPSMAINGLLLGTLTSDDTQHVHVEDAVPLFHGHLNLAMAVECALIQVNAYARNGDLQVVGVYHANEAADDRQISSSTRAVADKVQQQCCAHAVMLLIDNNLIGDFLRGKCASFIQLYGCRGSQSWSASASPVQLESKTIPQQYVGCIGGGMHRQLADFDDHMDDLTRCPIAPSPRSLRPLANARLIGRTTIRAAAKALAAQ